MLSVAFRADASVEIGTGHVMRCLTLADALARAGAHCRFLCRDLPGHRADLVAARGHAVGLLPPAPNPRPDTGPDAPRHATWLPGGQAADASACAELLREERPDCVVVDHYAIDASWERALRPLTGRMFVIDDLADRAHECDILLDQNLGRTAADYYGLVPLRARRLIGPHFALLGPGFAAAREESLTRRKEPALNRLLVSLGGVDRDNVTGAVLDALGTMVPPLDHVDVVLGAAAPWRDDVADRAGALPLPVTLHVETPHMARLMAAADLAIGAGGGTSWERCCLGLPTLLLVLAANQAPAAGALEAAGACANLGHPAALDIADRLRDNVRAMADPDRLAAMSRAAAALVDGHGSARVAGILTGART